MSKKIFSLLIAAGVFSAIAVGCGSDPAPADDDDTPTTKKDSGTKKKTTKTDDTGDDDTSDDDDTSNDSGSASDADVSVKKDAGTVKPPADSGTINPPPVDSGVVMTDSGTVADSGTTPPPPACYIKTEVTGFAAFTFPTGHAHQAGKCTAGQITAIANACGSELSGGAGSCYSTTKAQPTACANCAWTSFSAGQTVANTGPFYDDSTNADINVAGCIDIATGTAGCGAKAYNYIACLSAACGTCTTDADVDACSDQASIDGCVTKSGLDSACVTAYNANGTAAAACFPPAGSTVAAEWTTWTNDIVSAFCK